MFIYYSQRKILSTRSTAKHYHMNAILPVLAALLLFSSVPVSAQAWDAGKGPVQARLVSEVGSIRPGQTFTVALALSADPDWHTYWKFPGESGLPTTLRWDLPPGFTAGPIRWPVPERFISQGLVTYGYPGRVMLLSDITAPRALPSSSITLRARATWLACRVECTPGTASLVLSLPAGSGEPAAAAANDFTRARASLPVAGGDVKISAFGDAGSLALSTDGIPVPDGARASFYPDGPGMVKVSVSQGVERKGPSSLVLRLQREGGAPARLTGLLVVTGTAGTRALEVDAPVTARTNAGSGWSLITTLLLAFVGGLILNLMPCVLPVISLKALGILRQGGSHGARHGLLFTLGVLVSFWIIAAVLEGLRAGGHALGWGFQFQNPVVVVVAAMLFFLIGLNLFGVFEVGLAVTRLGGRLGGSGGKSASGGGSFATGVFATAVATPCTAPFMGAAVGYALTHSVAASLGVFTALGLGMAAPSLALSVWPGLAARLPKPGPWMETFRQVMAFPMMAAAVWMISVLASLSGSTGAVVLVGGMLVVGLGAWIWGRWGTLSRTRGTRVAAGVLAVVLAVGATVVVARMTPRVTGAAAAPASTAQAGGWEPWSAKRVEELRKAGTPVFVDFSAQWCLTCLVNERVALANPAVRSRFQQAGVATLRADWTDTNDEIAAALGSFGRASVPLYVFYPGGGREPVVLPEILTPGIVLGAVPAASP